MSDPLYPAVAAAIAEFGARADAWRTLSSIHTSHHRRTTMRVDLADGRRVKARAVEDAATAQRLADVRRQAPAAFAAVLHVHRHVLIETWIDGTALSRDVDSPHLTAAASLLASLHGTSTLSGRALPAAEPTAPERTLAAAALARLASIGMLAADEAGAIDAALAHGDPGVATMGFVHTDFCGENMVVDGRGQLHVIDNERMGVGMLGLDVARTWYRWALPPDAWAFFLRAYAAALPNADALVHFPFWALVATLKSAALRLELAPPGVDVALVALRRVLAQAERRS